MKLDIMTDADYIFQQRGLQNHAGSPENHRPYVPQYSSKDEWNLRRVDLACLDSINSTFFPEEYTKGPEFWVAVPKHILGIDTDFAFVTKKIEEFSRWNPTDQKRELARWDNMQRWERNMYEDRISILMQQKSLMSMSSPMSHQHQQQHVHQHQNQQPVLQQSSPAGVLMSRVTGHKRNREFQAASMTPSKRTPSKSAASEDMLATATSPSATAMSQAANMVVSYSEVPDSKARCLRMKLPIPSRYQGNIEADKEATVPEFVSLMNFPALSLPDHLRCCVMCGKGCPTAAAVKSKMACNNGSKANPEEAFIPTQNKGLCTLCDVNVWVVDSSGMQIKWCKGCKNFRCWASFGEKGHATKCLRCRERQREKYAAQKEEKEKKVRDKVLKGKIPTK